MRYAALAVPTVGLALMIAASAASAAETDAEHPNSAPVTGSTRSGQGDDHGAKPATEHGTQPGDDHSTKSGKLQAPMPGMEIPADEHDEPVSRPRGLVIGGFAAVNGVVLLAAAGVRRRSPAAK